MPRADYFDVTWAAISLKPREFASSKGQAKPAHNRLSLTKKTHPRRGERFAQSAVDMAARM
jgi:hypothetical protein